MPNLRVVSDNAFDRVVSPTASSAASTAMGVGMLQTDLKANVWRSNAGTTQSIRGAWSVAELIALVAFPYCNFSPTATMRVRLTNEAQATNLLTAPNDFTNSAWSKTTVSTTPGVLGPDGTNSATTLTVNAAYSEISQSVSVQAGSYTSSIFLRLRSGTGGANIKNNAGAWVPLALTSNWTRYSNGGGSTGTTALLDLQLINTGDQIDIAFGQVEAGGLSSYYAGTRPLGYIDSWQSYSYDSGNVLCCPDPVVTLRGWTPAQAASAYSYGGGSFARVWLPTTSALGICVDIVDTNNLQGYIEAARMVAAPYWETACNPSAVTITNVDTTVHTRLESGDQWTDQGKTYKKMAITLSKLPSQDRAPFFNMVRNSRAYPILVSVMPLAANEAETLIYGRRSADSDAALQFALTYSSSVEVQGI